MKVNGAIIKKLRKEAKISQKALAEKMFVSEKQFSRYETGESEMSLWVYFSFMEAIGMPSENYWVLYMDSNEYNDYLKYKKLRRLLRDSKYKEIAKLLPEFKKTHLSNEKFIKQFIDYLEVLCNEQSDSLTALNRLFDIICQSIPSFDEAKIDTYRMTYNELCIVSSICDLLFNINEDERALSILLKILDGRKKMRTSEDDIPVIFPPIMCQASNNLGRIGKIDEALTIAEEGLKIALEYNNIRCVPALLYIIACCKDLKNEPKEEIKGLLLQAYWGAKMCENLAFAETIKKDAKESFNIFVD